MLPCVVLFICLVYMFVYVLFICLFMPTCLILLLWCVLVTFIILYFDITQYCAITFWHFYLLTYVFIYQSFFCLSLRLLPTKMIQFLHQSVANICFPPCFLKNVIT